MAVDLYVGYYVFVRPAVDSVEPMWLVRAVENPQFDLVQSTFVRFWCNGTYHAECHETCSDCTQGEARTPISDGRLTDRPFAPTKFQRTTSWHRGNQGRTTESKWNLRWTIYSAL